MLSDFGISRVIVASQVTTDTTSVKCSMRWMARELFPELHGTSFLDPVKANEKTDVWAFGMTVYVSKLEFPLVRWRMTIVQEILTGKRPFGHLHNDAIVMFAITQDQLPLEPQDLDARSALDQKLWTLCKKCWSRTPSLRPSMVHVLEDVNEYGQDDSDPPSRAAGDEEHVSVLTAGEEACASTILDGNLNKGLTPAAHGLGVS
jgi:serine/threonine protein kinase